MRDSYSTNPKAIYSRQWRLKNPEAEDRNAEKRAAYNRAKRQTAIVGDVNFHARMSRMRQGFDPSKTLLARVARHMAKGRDAADIAVRENILLSLAQRAVGLITCPETKPTHDSTASGDRGRA